MNDEKNLNNDDKLLSDDDLEKVTGGSFSYHGGDGTQVMVVCACADRTGRECRTGTYKATTDCVVMFNCKYAMIGR